MGCKVKSPTKFTIPTFDPENEFVEPNVPVLVYDQEHGIRVVLGAHDPDNEKPDVLIERRKNGWAIFLHPTGWTDPSGAVFFHDDGRSWCVPDGLPNDRICVDEAWDEVSKELDK